MRRLWSVGAVMLTCLVLGGAPALGQASAAPAAQGATVTVTVNQAGAAGSGLAAILFRDGDWQAGLGSFVADVTSDTFTFTESIREGPPFTIEPISADRPVATIPPGTHNLVVWLANGLHSYAEWTPSAPIDGVCLLQLTVREGSRVAVEVSVPPADGSGYVSTLPACQA